MEEPEETPRSGADGRSTRWEAHRVRRQGEILDAALAVIDEEGPEVGVRRIAERIGAPRSAVYRHFRDRADLDGRIRRRALDSLLAELGPTLEPDGTVLCAIRRSVDAYLGWIAAHPQRYAFLSAGEHGGRSPDTEGTKAVIAHRAGTVFKAVLRALGKEDAGLAVPLASGLVGFVDATVDNWLAGRPDAAASAPLAEFLTRSVWAVLDGNLRALGVQLPPDQRVSALLGD
ncbi:MULTISPECIES: TetR/AcrR family transcriptional regulator [Streptomyces]|uniref:TetR family transcriptional regulator n=1 Tax=Streptomyces albus (strain ATCC 21838 / DSM 41398 / FERM P-419 / JCM 4703 / NBRC 107858) TaxID=1081613 RepID=A0A0B5EHR1_STRA4|nr:TetR/AcrR family transcriptional regulator [Streptomyces sp. SCSIO ZS0520]AJE80924.1 TetR family transcriptional regulator [Streptomyces albus]AOU75237.1 TetR family transcriptional regulator [Streptomyces albus]AYN31042.1 TetR family transcriptional regulator [Streptomyces albus]